jgi:type I restriction enzyme S subunit
MKWLSSPIKEVAPSAASKTKFSDSDQVWHLNLDQIESQTGKILEQKMAPASSAGNSTYVFNTKNVLYSKLRPYLNKVVCPEQTGIATTELVPLCPNPKVLDRKFLTYFLRSNRFLNFASTVVAGAKMPRVIMAKFWDYEIPLPPISEQRRIVEILDQADRLRRLRADADTKAQHILPALFIKMFGDPLTNPMGWKIGTLGDVCERITDGTHQPPPFVENGIPFLFVQNIVKGVINFNTQKFITEETYRSLTRTITPQKDDILYSTVGSYGVAVVVDTNRLFLFQRHIGHLRPKGALMDSWFLCAQMNTPYVKAQADQRARGLAQKTLNLSEIRQFQVIIPPLVEQKKFKLAMQNFKKITGRVNDQEILIESLFKIILQRAFTGDLTTSWRKAHMKELLQEMEIQAKALAS